MANPSLAVDWIRDRVQFPAILQPKVDGVRGGQYAPGKFTGRSLKAHKNRALTLHWSNELFYGLDGELVAPGMPWTHPALCRTTSSICSTIKSAKVPHLIAFDFVRTSLLDEPYKKRYNLLVKHVAALNKAGLHVMPYVVVREMDELLAQDDQWVDEGYEGTIVRNPYAPFKEDRSTLAMELWRIKRTLDFEVKVKGVVEAMRNDNEAKTNALGRTERSTHKANKVGKGMVGMIQGWVVKDVLFDGRVLFPKGMLIDVGPGKMSHAEREAVWRDPTRIAGKIGKVKVQPYGTKEKPRQPVWLGLRAKEDMS